MRRTALLVVVIGACALGSLTAARAAGTFAVTPSSVSAGAGLSVSFCGFAAGQAGYYTVNGPSVAGTRFWGPASGPSCLTYAEATAGWAAGKYTFIAFVTTATGRASRVGAATVAVSAP
jgi:hypothetical protein